MNAFGLGGCNSAAVLQVRIIEAKTQSGLQDLKNVSLSIEAWVQAENTLAQSILATSVGKITFAGQNQGSPLHL